MRRLLVFLLLAGLAMPVPGEATYTPTPPSGFFASLPTTSLIDGQQYTIIDSTGGCAEGGGSLSVTCRYQASGNTWTVVGGGGGTTPTFDQVMAQGHSYTGAGNAATAFEVGGPTCKTAWWDSGTGMIESITCGGAFGDKQIDIAPGTTFRFTYGASHTVAASIAGDGTKTGFGTSTGDSARVYNSVGVSIANNTPIALTFDSERWDSNNLHSTSSNTSRLLCPTTGDVLLTGHVVWGNSATGIRELFIRYHDTVGNTDANIGDETHTVVTGNDVASVSTLWRCTAGDYFELIVRQTSGGALFTAIDEKEGTEFALRWLGN